MAELYSRCVWIWDVCVYIFRLQKYITVKVVFVHMELG